MRRKSGAKILSLLVIIGMLVFGGCTGQEAGKQSDTALNADTLSSETNTITDDLGREVEIPANPQKVLALTKNMMDELYEIGIIPVGRVEEYKNREELCALPSVSTQQNPNLEAIYELKPDLILANTFQHAQMAEGLEKSGAAVYFIDPTKVANDPWTDRITLMGSLLNREAEASAYLEKLDQLSAELQEKIAPANYQTGLMLLCGGDTISAAQPTGVWGALLVKLGIENIVPSGLPGSDKSTWVTYDAESIIEADPDLIILKASSNDKEQQKKIKSSFMQNPAWKELKAVKNANVYLLPGKYTPGNASNEEILDAAARIIYPQGFE